MGQTYVTDAGAEEDSGSSYATNNTSPGGTPRVHKMENLPERCLTLFPRTAVYEKAKGNRKILIVLPSIVAGINVNVSELEEDELEDEVALPLTAYGCSLSPDNDCLLVTTSVLSHQVPGRVNTTPSAGFVVVRNIYTESETESEYLGKKEDSINYDTDVCSGVIFTYSPKPCCKFSPDGETVSAILNSGKESITIMGIELDADDEDDEEEFPWFAEKSLKNLGHGGTTLCGKTICFVYSRFGDKVATVSNVSLQVTSPTHRNRNGLPRNVHELCVWRKTNNTIKSLSRVSCEVAYPPFQGQVCDCKFSPDGSLVGISSTFGQLVLFTSNADGLWTALPPYTNEEDQLIFSPCHFDFNPSYGHSLIATAWKFGMLCIWCCKERNLNEKLFTFETESNVEIHSLKYSQDANLLALGTSNGQVIILSSDFGHCLYNLDALNDSNVLKILPETSDTTVYDISFCNSCQELCAAYGDGIIRFWQLPRILNLQHICRLNILTFTPTNVIQSLSLPEKLKMYLLYYWRFP